MARGAYAPWHMPWRREEERGSSQGMLMHGACRELPSVRRASRSVRSGYLWNCGVCSEMLRSPAGHAVTSYNLHSHSSFW